MRTRCLLLFLLFVSRAIAQDDKGTYDELAQKVEKKIRSEKKVQVDQLRVLNQAGTIYLEGIADLYGSRYRAGQLAAKVDRVKKVDNQIAVTSREVSDLEIQSQLLDRIQRHIQGQPFDLVSIRVSHGFVTLAGNVRDTTLIKKSFDEAIWVTGVRGVENKMIAASISEGDERLRQVIFDRLSREYPQYFVGRLPSVIILVEHGRVTLVGYVNSATEKIKIASVIRSLIGVLSVDIDQLQTK